MNSISSVKGRRRIKRAELERKVRSLYRETLAVPEDAQEDVALHPLLFGPNRLTGAEFKVLVKKNPLWEQYRPFIEQRDTRYDDDGRYIGKGM